MSDEDETRAQDPNDISFTDDQKKNPDYSATESDCEVDLHADRMFVEWKNLEIFLKWCQQCGAPSEISKVLSKGASISVHTHCHDGHKNTWNSLSTEYPEGQVTLAASILLSGLTYHYQQFSEAISG